MNQSRFTHAATTVVHFAGLGFLFFVLSFLPVGSDSSRRVLLACTMPGAIMFTWISAGLGLYGIVRYPSRNMNLAATGAVAVAALTSVFFWRLAHGGFLAQ